MCKCGKIAAQSIESKKLGVFVWVVNSDLKLKYTFVLYNLSQFSKNVAVSSFSILFS